MHVCVYMFLFLRAGELGSVPAGLEAPGISPVVPHSLLLWEPEVLQKGEATPNQPGPRAGRDGKQADLPLCVHFINLHINAAVTAQAEQDRERGSQPWGHT